MLEKELEREFVLRLAWESPGNSQTIVANQFDMVEGEPELEVSFAISEGTEIFPGWILTQQLPMILEFDDDGTYIVSDAIFSRYGAGESFKAAMFDFITGFIDYYEIMSRDATEEYPATQALFQQLQQFINHSNKQALNVYPG
jgi:hypothetical protein